MRHSFSVQMGSTESILSLVINRKRDRVFIEGELGLLEGAECSSSQVRMGFYALTSAGRH